MCKWMLFECCCRHLPYHIISAAAPWETGAPISYVKYAKWARGAAGSFIMFSTTCRSFNDAFCADMKILNLWVGISFQPFTRLGGIYVQSESRLPTAMGWFDQLNIFCQGFLHWIELKIISGSTIQKCFRIVSDWLSNRIGWKYSRYSRLEWLYLEYSAARCHSCFLLFGCAHIWAQVQRWVLF